VVDFLPLAKAIDIEVADAACPACLLAHESAWPSGYSVEVE